jgi:3-hydroxyisobutyrate dehydrogenase
MAIKKVAFIGIGNMGSAMAAHLVRNGFDVTVYDIRPEMVAIFVEKNGGTGAGSAQEAARDAEAVITMLPNDRTVREVVLGDSGVALVLKEGAIVLDMSTSDPVATRRLAEALKPRGITVVDAPVMGGVMFADDASLDIMAGGDTEAIERCKPLFQAMGRSVMECGGVGNGHALKALANYVNACALINSIEALTIGKRFGLDAKFMAEALVLLCAERNHPIRKKVLPQVLTRKFSTGMALGLIAKDVKIARDTADSIEAFAPLAEKVAELWTQAAEKLGPGVDQTEIARYWEEATGVRLS